MASEPAQSFTLTNGMKFVVARDDMTPAASVGFFVRTGICDEPEDRRGIAHFFEHMMFRGSENVGAQEHARIVSRLGGSFNGGTSPDFTVYFETVPSRHVEEVFRLEADRFLIKEDGVWRAIASHVSGYRPTGKSGN